jgi:23S rRNA U2552 (ribose-2'-O)-methylase RlmE/FtsJ
MIYFLLPNVHYNIFEYLNCETSLEIQTPMISQSLSKYLNVMKYKINDYEKEWDIYKKYTNPFEFINTIPPNKSKCISNYKPLSRSYYKMIEIITTFNLLNKNSSPIETFHIAEGPGGFIEAFVNKRKNAQDKYTGITLLDDIHDINIPAWKKSEQFLKNNTNVYIENGIDNTGNILSIENFEHCVKKYGSSMNIITGDGGFDFSNDFDNQEINTNRLLFAQICYALCLQKKNGHFILKIFDCFMQSTVDLIYILCSFYKHVYITKPQTSRYANSEKYLVCKNFIFDNNKPFYIYFYNCFKILLKNEEYTKRFLNCNIANLFLNKLEEFNSVFGQQQIETITNTINCIEYKNKSDKLDNMVKMNIQKSISWCVKHDIDYNYNISNSFINESI